MPPAGERDSAGQTGLITHHDWPIAAMSAFAGIAGGERVRNNTIVVPAGASPTHAGGRLRTWGVPRLATPGALERALRARRGTLVLLTLPVYPLSHRAA